jgi:hypothetical protein
MPPYLLVAYLAGVLPVHRIDGGARVHVHQVVVVVAGHHAPAPIVELHEAGVGGRVAGVHPAHRVRVAAPPGDLQAGSTRGCRLASSVLSWPQLASSLATPGRVSSPARVSSRGAATMCGVGSGPKCSLRRQLCARLLAREPLAGGCRPAGSGRPAGRARARAGPGQWAPGPGPPALSLVRHGAVLASVLPPQGPRPPPPAAGRPGRTIAALKTTPGSLGAAGAF